MLTREEIVTLEQLLARARSFANVHLAAPRDVFAVGDVVQLRPDADPHWETSLLLVCRVRDDGGISGPILRPHRGGYREAWYTYRPPSVARIGHMPFGAPSLRINSWAYDGPGCLLCANRLDKGNPARAR